jgi:hypothetical protein
LDLAFEKIGCLGLGASIALFAARGYYGIQQLELPGWALLTVGAGASAIAGVMQYRMRVSEHG